MSLNKKPQYAMATYFIIHNRVLRSTFWNFFHVTLKINLEFCFCRTTLTSINDSWWIGRKWQKRQRYPCGYFRAFQWMWFIDFNSGRVERLPRRLPRLPFYVFYNSIFSMDTATFQPLSSSEPARISNRWKWISITCSTTKLFNKFSLWSVLSPRNFQPLIY